MRARRLREELGLIAAVAAGAALRLWDLHEQIVLDDEWHALHAILRFGYGRILTHFGWTDFCIPLALYDKAVADTVGLSEAWMRLPVLLAGLATLLLVPLLARPWLGRAAATAFAWLLAASPLHVFLSRYARPYAVSLFLLLLGGLALARWWGEGGRRRALAGIAGLALAPYFHLSALAPVLAVLALGLLAAAAVRGAPRRPREVLVVTGAVLLGLAVLLGPPLAVDHAALAYKVGRADLEPAAARGALELLAGTASAPLIAALLALVLAGAVVLARRAPALLALLGALALSGPAVLVATAPVGIGDPIVAVRYCLAALPAGALLAAAALARAEEALRARRAPCPSGTLTALAVGALLLAGPLPRAYARPNNWAHHGRFQYAYDPARLAWSCPAEVPRFYRDLAAHPPGSLRILEAPWWHAWSNAYQPCYQDVHRQYMAIGFVSPVARARSPSGLPRAAELPLLAPGAPFRFRNFVHVADEDGLRRRGIRYVVFHRSLEVEMGVDSPDYRADIEPWVAHYRSRYGPPVYEDGTLLAFDVAPVPAR